MAFDWQQFLDRHNIEYQTSGANVSAGHVTIHCPFCGAQDPSYHMSVHLGGRGWHCWRNPDHAGKSPVRLVQALLGVTTDRARQMVGQAVYVPEDFMARVQKQFESPPVPQVKSIKLLKEFKPFGCGMPSEKLYRNYLLHRRGFKDHEVDIMTERWGMFYCTSGPFASRVIFTVRHEGRLVNWTGRSISDYAELRYRALSPDPERAKRDGLPTAVGAVSHYLLWYDKLLKLARAGYHTLVLSEGPIDALKINIYGRHYGICGTCLFTAAPTPEQVELLHSVCPQFRRRILLLDRGTLALGMRVSADLAGLDIRLHEVPFGLKDPGEFTKRTFGKFALALRA